MSDKVSVFIDNCAWEILHSQNINLSQEFPTDQFEIKMSKEINSFEVAKIPKSKMSLKKYIEKQMELCDGSEDSYFGFSSMYDPPGYKSRNGGFGEGRFITYEEAKIHKEFEHYKTSKVMGSGLFQNEADISLAVRACVGAIVLTAERENKNGPLKKAREQGGLVVSLLDFSSSNLSLREFVTSKINSEN